MQLDVLVQRALDPGRRFVLGAREGAPGVDVGAFLVAGREAEIRIPVGGCSFDRG